MKKALITIILVSLAIFTTIQLIDFDYLYDFTSLITIISALTVFITTITLAVRYNRTNFLIPYMFLAGAFLFYALAEVIWWDLESKGLETYPSMADFAYLGFYVGSLLHVLFTTQEFVKPKKTHYIILWIISTVGTIWYATAIGGIDGSIVTELFILLNMMLVVFSGYTAVRLKNTLLQWPWLLLAIGICLGATTDVYYYILEANGGLTDRGIEHTLWILSDMIIIMGLLMHRRKI